MNGSQTYAYDAPGQRTYASLTGLQQGYQKIVSWASGARSAFNTQQHKYTSYERDGNGGDDAMNRRCGAKVSRNPTLTRAVTTFTDPQSFIAMPTCMSPAASRKRARRARAARSKGQHLGRQ